MKDPYAVILEPVITEQSYDLSQKTPPKYLFKVSPESNKIEIKQAVEQCFGVKVTSVNTMNLRGKPKRLGLNFGKRPNWKKALVTLKAGDSISLF